MKNTETVNPQNVRKNNPEQEIDLVDLLHKLWVQRRFILKVVAAFMVIGLLLALFGRKEYTAGGQFVPQTSRSMSSSSMSSLAALAGINLGNIMGNEQLISPMVYPNIVNSNNYKRDLLQTKITLADEEEPITLLTYLTDEKYERFSLVGTILKYTIGLPGVIVRAIKGEPERTELNQEEFPFVVLSKEEKQAVSALKDILSIDVEEKYGYIEISAQMPEPMAAAQVAESAITLLEHYVTEFKLQKVADNLAFVQGRYEEVKADYERIQAERAAYKDANQGLATSRAQTMIENLDNQYQLANGIYSEMAAQLERAKIQVKETTPVFTMIDPVTLPNKPSKPRRMMTLVGFTFLGILAACGYVLLKPTVQQIFRDTPGNDEPTC